ncbi:MAG: zeta toxin family protein [Bacteroidales bacterium]|nr:zeta toxin family protein [Bacteroidales bacterium]
MKKLYIIAGCNGAGKTTASYTILPEILDCKEFVNADEIARGLSPFQPENAGIEAGRLMLKRIKVLYESGVNFAFETTLAPKSYVNLINMAKQNEYQITLVFFWLHSSDLAISRVKNRVNEGGHDIPKDVIIRRYKSGLSNFFKLYQPIIDNWIFINNSGEPYEVIAEGSYSNILITNNPIWRQLKTKYYAK